MMTTTLRTPRRTGRYIAVALGTAGAASAFGAGAAQAADLSDALTLPPGGIADTAVAGLPELPPAPQLPSPVLPVDLGILPQNLLRTGGREDHTSAPIDGTSTLTVQPATPAEPSTAQITAAKVDYNERIATTNAGMAALNDTLTQIIPGITADDLRDPAAIAQASGTFTPDQATFSQIGETTRALADAVVSGQAVRDVQTVVDNVLASEEYQAWQTNTANPRNPERVGADGVADLIDSFTTNPTGTINQLVLAAGGPQRIITDPIGAFNDVARGVAGEQFVTDIWNFVNNDLSPDFADSLREAAPALLLIPALAAAGALLGAPLGALPGSGIGALLGALAPHNLLGAIPGSIIGGLLTGIPGALAGLVASSLIFLPGMLIAPLMGGALGSALALVIASTLTYGLWLLTLIPVALAGLAIGALAGIAVAVGLAALSGFNPIMLLAAGGGGLFAAAFVFIAIVGGYTLLTFLLPTIAFLILAPLLTLGIGGLSALAGLALGALAAAIGIPLITALAGLASALPGAIIGGLLGIGLSNLISALLGSVLGGLIGAAIGSLIGATLGGALGTAIGVPLFLIIALLNFGDRASEWMNGPLGRVADTLRQGWERSLLRDVLDRAQDEWNTTDTGSTMNNLIALVNSLFTMVTTLDGRRLRDLILRGAIAGAVPGALAGAALGGPLGALLGLLSPLNLLGGLLGGLTGALVGAPLGAAAGKGLSLLLGALTTLIATPLLFLPILAALSLAWAALAIPATLAALAATLIPPLALATAATIIGGLLLSSPLWIPLIIGATILTLVAFALSNTAIIAAFPPLVALLPFNLAIGTVGMALAWAAVIVIVGALALAALFIGLPTFLLTIPLFIFPALAVPLLSLLALPLLIPVAAGLSLLGGMALGSLVDNLSSLLTVPLGALLGALTGATIGAVSGYLVNAITRAVVYGLAGAGLGALTGAGIGGVIGAILALISSVRIGGGQTDGTFWADGRIVPNDALDSLPIPGVGTTRKSVPVTADPYTITGAAPRGDRELVDVSQLVAA